MSTTLTFSNVSVTVPESRIGQLLAGRLELTGILGVGAYGIVYNAVDIFTCTPYAVKALTKNGLDPRQKQFQQREIALHLKASAHPNIVSLVKIVETSDCIFVVLEYCSEGDLFTNITERGHYVGNDALAKQVFLHLLDAVEHCHSLGIYHRDLKPENVLVCDGGMRVKLADFGLATTDRYTTDFGCGSTFYMSPECQQSASRSQICYESAPNDVWSLGVILVNLTCGRNPWKRASQSESSYRAYLKDRRNFLTTILPVSAGLNSILQKVFEPDPIKRITVSELRARIMACPKLTNGPGVMDSPAVSEVSDVSEFQFSEFNLPAASPSGTLTPPESAPSTPHNQSIHSAFPFNKPPRDTCCSTPSPYYAEATANVDASPVVLPSPMDFVTPSRNFWPFQFFRRDDVDGMNSSMVSHPHQGVAVF
jgi:serine/threonine protein kinase